MCFFISNLASNSGEGMDIIPFYDAMVCWNGEIWSHLFLCISSLLEKVIQVLLRANSFPLHLLLHMDSPFPSWLRPLFSPGDAQWSVKKSVLWLGERNCTWAQDFHCVPWKRWLGSCKHICVSPQAGIGTNIEAAASFCGREYNLFPDGNIWPSLIIIIDYACF